jgi:hypothetical protein
MNEEIKYLTINAKKHSQDSERMQQGMKDYQQIVRKLEINLLESQHKREKIENELNIIKQQMFN